MSTSNIIISTRFHISLPINYNCHHNKLTLLLYNEVKSKNQQSKAQEEVFKRVHNNNNNNLSRMCFI